jgi:hypothetical protein
MEQRDGDGLHPLGEERGDGLARARGIERGEDAAVGEQPLTHLEPEVPRHERGGRVDEEIVHVIPAFAADLEGIAEPRRGEEPRLGALALDQRIRGQRRAVDEGGHARGVAPGLVEQGQHPLLDGLGRLLGRRQELADAHGARPLIDQHEVGEGAADVHSDARATRSRCAHEGEVYRFTPRPSPTGYVAGCGKTRRCFQHPARARQWLAGMAAFPDAVTAITWSFSAGTAPETPTAPRSRPSEKSGTPPLPKTNWYPSRRRHVAAEELRALNRASRSWVARPERGGGIGLGPGDLGRDPERLVHPVAGDQVPGLVHHGDGHQEAHLLRLRQSLVDALDGGGQRHDRRASDGVRAGHGTSTKTSLPSTRTG